MSNSYLEYVLDLLSPFDSITFRAMFGGYGLYKNGVIFALIAHDELYFKVDQSNIDLYKEHGSEAFTFEAKGKVYKMSYWKVPLLIMEDETKLKYWIEQSYNISLKNNKTKWSQGFKVEHKLKIQPSFCSALMAKQQKNNALNSLELIYHEGLK